MPPYADVADLRLVLDSTDAGTGTAAQLTDEQLTLALQAASDRVEVYVGASWANPADVPPMVHDLTLDLATWWAWTYYSKSKEMGPNHPVVLRYTEAKGVLEDIRKGVIDLDVPAVTGAGGSGDATSAHVNNMPNVFTGQDSNTVVIGGQVYVDTPPDMVGPRRLLDLEAYP